MATTTKIKPADFADMNLSTYERLFNKDLAKLSKKTGFHDFVFIKDYKFGSKKRHVILFVDSGDDKWTATLEQAKNNVSGVKKSGIGSCKIVEVDDRDGDGDSDITLAIKSMSGSLSKKQVIDLINDEMFADNGDVEAVLIKELTDTDSETDESELSDAEIIAKRTREKTGASNVSSGDMYDYAYDGDGREDELFKAFIRVHDQIFDEGERVASDVIDDFKFDMTTLKELYVQESQPSDHFAKNVLPEAIALNNKIDVTLEKLEDIVEKGENWLEDASGRDSQIAFETQETNVKEQIRIVKKMMIVVAKMDAAVEKTFELESRIGLLLEAGATSSEIIYMLSKEEDAEVIHTLIQDEANKSAKQIHDLYYFASSAQIVDLLRNESNAETLNSQILRETSNSPDLILQLYIDKLESAQITRMLQHIKDGRVLHELIQPIPATFTPAKIQMASAKGDKVGSIYFEVGRIRLVHDNGPKIVLNDPIERCTVSEADNIKYRHKASENGWQTGRDDVEIYDYITKLDSYKEAAIGDDARLIEFLGDRKIRHISRGQPVAFNHIKTQQQLNIVYNAVRFARENNDTFRKILQIDVELAAIPMN